jgi:Cu(I)/Ag(I) efflux system membrane fusion protein/cobalt-zinc-cadmium efflux system membrane fusion protein
MVSDEDSQLYTCGMHPEIVSDEPGICPICNMKLTPKRDGGNHSGTVQIDPVTRQNIGLVTKPASYQNMTKAIYTFGRVAIPDPNRFIVTVKVDGWIERLFVAEEGEQVFKGQPLFELYSPALVSAQEELLLASKSDPEIESVGRLAEIAERRLLNWDISEDQIRKLKESGEVVRTLIIRSPADGFVKTKTVDEGDRISAQSSLFEIVDLSEVWIIAYVYEQDLPYIKIGQAGLVSVPGLPGRVFESRLNYISPLLDERGQTELRFVLDNDHFELKPEMYADIRIGSELDNDRLTIPRSAVINSGVKELVFVATAEDSYEPRIVKTGAVDDQDMVEIIDGLNAGEEIVVSGQFLLDSETRLNETIEAGGTTDPHAHHMHVESEQMEPAEDPYDVHTCPMPEHYHVLNYGSGECPECGMDLVPIDQTDNQPVYVCPMPRCGPVMIEPGLCSHCNMVLVEYEPGGSHDK